MLLATALIDSPVKKKQKTKTKFKEKKKKRVKPRNHFCEGVFIWSFKHKLLHFRSRGCASFTEVVLLVAKLSFDYRSVFALKGIQLHFKGS